MNLADLVKAISTSESDHWSVFFNAKTHKLASRVTISASESWQKALSLLLKENLNRLLCNDPFALNSDEVSFLDNQTLGNISAFWKFCIIHFHRCEYTVQRWGSYWQVQKHSFLKWTEINISGFTDLSSSYLKSTILIWNRQVYLQGVCFKSAITRVLSGLYLANVDNGL